MMKLEQIAADYTQGSLSKEDASKALMLILYTEREKWGLSHLSDENFSDFLQDCIEVIAVSLDKFLPERGSYECFFYSYVRSALRSWSKKLARHGTMQESLLFCASDEVVRATGGIADFFSLDDSDASVDDWEKDFFSYYVNSSVYHDRRREMFKEALLVLTLKSAAFIDEEMILRVARITGVGLEKLREMVSSARESIGRRRDELDYLKERREQAWFEHCRYRLEGSKIRESSSMCEAVSRKYDFHTRRWARMNERLGDKARHLCPTNETVGDLLGMDKRHVGYMIKHIGHQMDRFSAKCYSQGHENIPSNRQSEQKTGNE